MNESIVFSARKSKWNWLLYIIILFFIIIGLIKIVNVLLIPSAAYHHEYTVIGFSLGAFLFFIFFYFGKDKFSQKFYISNLGIKIKKGISGKLYSIDFKNIKLAVTYKDGKESSYSGLQIFCSNGQVVNTGVGYTNSSIKEAVQLLEQKNIKVFSDAKEAGVAADAIMNDNSCLTCNSEDQYSHYLVVYLPLILSLSLFLGTIINANYGNQQDIAIDVTILSKEIYRDKQQKIKGGEILVTVNGQEERFNVNYDFFMKSYSGEQLKMSYKRGSFDIDYNYQFVVTDNGSADGQMNLGVMYEQGLGVAHDYVEAQKWYRQVADEGNADAQNNVGFMYEKGIGGVARDYAEALKWYRLAADKGNIDAENNIGFMYEKGIGGVGKDYVEALKWYRLAADKGNAGAQMNIGNMYRNGIGMAQDYSEALKWYRQSADNGNTSAQTSIGDIYEKGLGVAKNYPETLKWYRIAANKGNVDAQNNIGFMYKNGIGVVRDYAEALKWYRMSADKGNKIAQRNLYVMYFYGYGVEKDDVQAYKWLVLVDPSSSGAEFRVLKSKMSALQIAMGDRLVEEWKGIHRY